MCTRILSYDDIMMTLVLVNVGPIFFEICAHIPLDQSDDIHYDDMIQYDMTINHIRHAMIYHDVKICM